MKLWDGGKQDNADPWDSGKRNNGYPWDSGKRNNADPWDSGKRNNRDPWDSTDRENAADPRIGPEQKDESSGGAEQEASGGTEQEASGGTEQEASGGTEQEASAGYGMQIAGAVMTLVSYALLFRLPDEMTPGAYVAFFLSVLLFCLGFFWVVADFPKPATRIGAVLRNGGICAGAAVLLASGCWQAYARNGSESGIYIATVLLIQSIALLTGLDKTETRAAKMAFRAVSAGLAGAGLWLFIRAIAVDSPGDGWISAATLLWIASGVLYAMFGKGGSMEAGEDGENGKK